MLNVYSLLIPLYVTKRNFIQQFVAAERPLILLLTFNCFKSSVLYDCYDPENNYNSNM